MKRTVWLATILSLLLIANLAYAGGKGSRGGSSSGSSAKYESSGKQHSDSGSSQSVKPSYESKPSYSSSSSHESKPSYSPSSGSESRPSYSPKPSSSYQPKPSSQGSYSYGPMNYSKPVSGPTYNYEPKAGGTTHNYGGVQPRTKYETPVKPQSYGSGQTYTPQKSDGPQFRDSQKTQPQYSSSEPGRVPQKSDGPQFRDSQKTRPEYSYGKVPPANGGAPGGHSGGVLNNDGRQQGFHPGDTAVLNDGRTHQTPNRDEAKLDHNPHGGNNNYGPGGGHHDYGYGGGHDDDHDYDHDHYVYEHGHARHHCNSSCHWWRPLFTFSYSYAYPVYVEVPVPVYYGRERPYDWSYIDDCEIYAADGAYLGFVARDYYREDSIANPEGPFGSRWSSTSIFNSECAYGDANSALSPWNPYTNTPPRLFYRGTFRGYLTVNTRLQPRVDPRWLVDGYLYSD